MIRPNNNNGGKTILWSKNIKFAIEIVVVYFVVVICGLIIDFNS